MKILFDTDIGSDIDDALALLLLLRIPHVELIGVTTVYGCTDIRAKIAKKILDAAGRPTPVFAGLGTPFRSPFPVWHAGTEGVGVLSAEEMEAPSRTMGILDGAVDFMISAVEEHGDDLTILSLGALTNVAACLRHQPSLASSMGLLYFMGGGITYRDPIPPTLTPHHAYRAVASHNVRCDVKAAQEVFSSGAPMTVLTNDVTTRIWWDGSPVQTFLASNAAPEAALVGRLLCVWLAYRSRIFEQPVTGTCPHDPLTAAEATGSRFVEYRQGTMHVHDDATTSFVPDERGPHRAGVTVDVGGFLDWFSTMMTRRA